MPSDAPPGEEPRRVVVLGYQFWQRGFLGDPGIIGRKMQLVHKTYEIVGVMPPRFKWGEGEVYLPLHVTQDPHIDFAASLKLRTGLSVAQASAELQPILEEFAIQSPQRYPGKFLPSLPRIIYSYPN